MQSDNRDLAFLWDMREAALDILEFIKDVDFSEFASNKQLRYAVERQILVIGEAAKRVSENFKQSHSEIPWKAIIGQRNILAHEYGEILVERIWLVAKDKIPELVKLLDPLIPRPPNESDKL